MKSRVDRGCTTKYRNVKILLLLITGTYLSMIPFLTCVYHAGFSKTLRRMTFGTTVSVYPIPMYDLYTLFLEAMLLRRARSSRSGRPSLKARGLGERILSGIVLDKSSSISLTPTCFSMASTSLALGPIWRRGKLSNGAKTWAETGLEV